MKHTGWAAGFLIMALTAPALAQENDPTFIPPSWARAPDSALVVGLLPPIAGLIGVSGWAAIDCLAPDDGHTFDCHVTDESPEGLGFGSAGRLIVASGEVRAARLNGEILPRRVSTRIFFMGPDLDEVFPPWTGHEPTEAELVLARQVVEIDTLVRPMTVDFLVRSLDFDRRAIVRGWIDELLPHYDETLLEIMAIQLARVMSVADMQAVIDGETVPRPDPDLMVEACPDPSAEELRAIRELRRRYCERWSCEARAT